MKKPTLTLPRKTLSKQFIKIGDVSPEQRGVRARRNLAEGESLQRAHQRAFRDFRGRQSAA